MALRAFVVRIKTVPLSFSVRHLCPVTVLLRGMVALVQLLFKRIIIRIVDFLTPAPSPDFPKEKPMFPFRPKPLPTVPAA
jgi:hypothetical protein